MLERLAITVSLLFSLLVLLLLLAARPADEAPGLASQAVVAAPSRASASAGL